MKSHVISIIIPALNEEKRLRSCLESIRHLQYPLGDIEVIVIDNGSVDGTCGVAEKSGARVFVDGSKNVAGLRNLGARKAKGDVLAFVDADCLVSAEWLDRAQIYFDKKDVAAWGAPPCIPLEATWVQRAWFIVRKKDNAIQEVNWLESMNLFVRREAFLSIGGFNESLVTCEDADLCYRIAKYGKIVSDSRIRVVHLGEAGTLKEFLKKEIWRGQGNLKGLFAHGFLFREIPSFSIPIYFGLLVPLVGTVLIITQSPNLLIILFSILLIPSMAALFKVRKKLSSMLDIFRLLVLLQVYFFARTIAVAINNRPSIRYHQKT